MKSRNIPENTLILVCKSGEKRKGEVTSHLPCESDPPLRWGSLTRLSEQIYDSLAPSVLCPDWTRTETQCCFKIHCRLNHINYNKEYWRTCDVYLFTVSRASASGGGIMKHAPGRVLVFPLPSWTFQFLPELDFRISFSSRLIAP